MPCVLEVAGLWLREWQLCRDHLEARLVVQHSTLDGHGEVAVPDLPYRLDSIRRLCAVLTVGVPAPTNQSRL